MQELNLELNGSERKTKNLRKTEINYSGACLGLRRHEWGLALFIEKGGNPNFSPVAPPRDHS